MYIQIVLKKLQAIIGTTRLITTINIIIKMYFISKMLKNIL